MNLVVDRRQEIIAAVCQATLKAPAERARAAQYGVTLELMQRHYARAVVVGLEHDSKIIGGMIFDDGQVHIGILNPMRGQWFQWLRPMLELGFSYFGPKLFAIVNKKNVGASNFTRRVGGVLVDENAATYKFEILRERMVYGRG